MKIPLGFYILDCVQPAVTEPLDPTMPLEIWKRKIGAMWQWRIFGLSDMKVSRRMPVCMLRIRTLNRFSDLNPHLNRIPGFACSTKERSSGMVD